MVIVPLAIITLFCFSYVMMQPARNPKLRKASAAKSAKTVLSPLNNQPLSNLPSLTAVPYASSTNDQNASPQAATSQAQNLQSAIPNNSENNRKSLNNALLNVAKPVTNLLGH
jgi:hypothetical protein